MLSFEQFADMMQRNATESVPGAEAAVLSTVVAVATIAKGLIGHENPEWAPLAPRTIAEKASQGYTGRISATDPLYRTGEMRESIEAVAEGLNGIVGSHDRVALWQEMGTLRPTGSIPPRPFLGLAMSRVYPIADKLFGELGVRLTTPKGGRT